MKTKQYSKLKTVRDILKVTHKKLRDEELLTEIGWKPKHKVVASKKLYNRKAKHKNKF